MGREALAAMAAATLLRAWLVDEEKKKKDNE